MPISKHLTNIDHIIWDWNGTLVDDVRHALGVVNRLLVQYKLPEMTLSDYHQKFQFPVRRYYELIGFDFNKVCFQTLCDEFMAGFTNGFDKVPLAKGIKEILTEAKTRTAKQSVLSAAEQTFLVENLEKQGIKHLFDHIFGLDNNHASGKIDRGRELIAESGISAQKTLLIGDTLHDLEVGQELGCEVILVSHGHQCVNRLRQHHDRVLEFQTQ